MSIAHHRIYEVLQDYWDKVRKQRIYPTENDINPEEIKDIWDSCFLVSFSEDDVKNGYKYTYLGKDLIEAFGDDLTNKDISERLMLTTRPPLVESFEEVIRTGKPLRENSEFTNSLNMVIKYRSCLLPLGNDPEKVDYILGAMKWKSF